MKGKVLKRGEHKRKVTDVLADKDPGFRRMNFCSVIRGSQWKG